MIFYKNIRSSSIGVFHRKIGWFSGRKSGDLLWKEQVIFYNRIRWSTLGRSYKREKDKTNFCRRNLLNQIEDYLIENQEIFIERSRDRKFRDLDFALESLQVFCTKFQVFLIENLIYLEKQHSIVFPGKFFPYLFQEKWNTCPEFVTKQVLYQDDFITLFIHKLRYLSHKSF